MTRASLVLVLSFLMAVSAPVATPQLAKTPSLHFATIDEGRSLLTKRDDFVVRLSPFDRAARVQIDKDVTEREFLRFVARSVRAWTAEERTVVESAWLSLKPKLDEMALPFPETVYFIKTSGAEEGGQEYTRGNSIILPESALSPQQRPSLNATIAHELFHVLSRNAPELRDKLYAVIGFQPCGEIEFPPALASRKLTDPDAPKNDHCILLNGDAGPVWAVPILFSTTERYNVAEGGPFFRYLQLKLLLVQRGSGLPFAARYDQAHIEFLDVDRAHGFYEQVGRNTNYIIHPEEILADNFRLLVLGKTDVPSPEVPQRLATALGEARTKYQTPRRQAETSPSKE